MKYRSLSLALAAGLAVLAAAGVARANHPVGIIGPTQRNGDGSALAAGGTANGTTVLFDGSSDAATCATENYYMEIELRPIGVGFSGIPNYSSTQVKSSCALIAYPTITVSGLAAGSYKWQHRERTTTGVPTTSPWVAFNGGGTAFVVGTPASLAANPTSLTFGSQRVGTSSAMQTVILTASVGPVTINSIGVSGGWTYSGIMLPVTLAAGQQTTVNVAYSPTTTGAASGTLVVNSTAANTPTTVSLTGTGIASKLSIAPTSLNFGSVKVGQTSTAVTFTVTNTGSATLNVGNFMLSGPFTATGLAPFALAPGGTYQFTMAFTPTQAGLATGTLTLPSDDPASPTQVAISGTGTAPAISLAPSAPLNFGGVQVGTTSGAQTVTINNTGNAPLVIGGGSTSGPFSVTGLGPQTIQVGGSASLTVRFSPTVLGNASGSLVINSDAPGSPTTYALAGRGIAPQITAQPTSLNFGTKDIGTTTPIVVNLTNPGEAKLTITAITIGGAHPGDYKLTALPTFPATVNPSGGTLAFAVEFKPTTFGTRTATVIIASDAYQTPNLSIAATGVGQGAKIALPQSTLDLGPSNVKTPSASKSFVVQNVGSLPLTVSGVTLSGTNAADFSIKSQFPVTINAGSSTSVAVVFTPAAVGQRTAKATVASDDPQSPNVDVTLLGLGTSPLVAVTPTSLDFTNVRVNTTSAGQTLTIKNNGTGPLTVSNLDLMGADAMRFAAAGGNLPIVIAAGQSAAVTVTFAPKTVGAATATLTVMSDDLGNNAVVVPLKGTGTAPQIALNPMEIDFGAQLVNRAAGARTVEIANNGTAPLRIDMLTLGGPQSAQFSLPGAPSLPLTIAVGQKQTVSVGFTATMVGVHDAELVIASDDFTVPTAKVPLKAVGSSSAVGVSPLEIEFGTLRAPAKSDGKKVTITNLSGDPITLVEATLDGPGKASFTVTPVAGPLLPGKSIEATVTYQTQMPSEAMAQITFASSDTMIPPATVKLHGKAIAKLIAVDPMMLDFGKLPVGMTAMPLSVKVTNLGSSPIEIMSVVSGDDQFVVDLSAAKGPIAAGASATFTATFAPSKVGPATTQLGITLKGDTMVEVSVAAQGVGQTPGGSGTGGGCDIGSSATAPALPVALVLLLAALALVVRGRRRRRSA